LVASASWTPTNRLVETAVMMWGVVCDTGGTSTRCVENGTECAKHVLTHRALRCWLAHRRTTWPHTDNPHVLVNSKTVHGTAPVNEVFVNRRINRRIARAGCTVAEIRADRILHEALTSTAGPDPLHLALVFGVCHPTAARYAKAAEHLLSGELEHPLVSRVIN